MPRVSTLRTAWERLKEHPLSRVGPGLITGVADDDPSGIATYSQAGAQFGPNMLWTMPLAFPLMAAVQSMCANLGRVTGKGLAANIKTSFPPLVLQAVVLLLLVANTLNIAADVAAMGEVAELVSGINRHLMTALFVFGTLLLQLFVPYHRYVFFLKWLTVSLLAYAAVLFTVHVPWGEVMSRTLWPKFTPNANAAAVVVGVLGTTISPYLFFWQASEEVEDMHARRDSAPLICDASAAPAELRRIRWDTWSGMLYSDITAYFIILATAVTLHVAGITDINTAAQAASALRPLAGNFAYILFALGILGVGLIGVPVLAGSGAYALSEAMGWKEGLERSVGAARGFYGIIAVSVLAALGIQYSPISPMKALFWSAVINGVVAVPLMAVIIILVSKKSVMGDFTASRPLIILGWVATALMGAAAIGMFIPS
ncbi:MULTISPECIES: NRAMP family divalent metal transporter [Paraburkholderia]|uniref:Divalent metal cation transporter n=1 Tax=Paraburkholderia madseniana TaxID=2599607 RepID=A0AAP5BA45_9BURK|nr:MULTISPECIES: divalent metal cation transporter [Paraburkholderia]MCX4145115.1 divalent metal cation transporter [Paraburkholderia madseniana]MDN7148066.1 divalent metal cation transporter [Paraburkholderia sp. WS6]MDQ6406946.1 divalent metal cation transporter [Paraburkholderia madseniana]